MTNIKADNFRDALIPLLGGDPLVAGTSKDKTIYVADVEELEEIAQDMIYACGDIVPDVNMDRSADWTEDIVDNRIDWAGYDADHWVTRWRWYADASGVTREAEIMVWQSAYDYRYHWRQPAAYIAIRVGQD